MKIFNVRTYYLSARASKLLPVSFRRTMCSEKPSHLERTAENKREEVISPATVTEIRDESKTVKRLTLKVHDRQFSFKPGQWVDMFIPDVDTVGGYSICSTPEQHLVNQEIELAVKYSPHPPAHWVHTKCLENSDVKLRVGGDFYFNADSSPIKPDLLLIAGGIGITPLFSIWQHCRDLNVASIDYSDIFGKLLLLYSAKTQDDLIFDKEIKEIEDTSTNIHCQRFFTKEKGERVGVKYRRIGAEDITKAFDWLKKDATKVFLCGPGQMIEDMESILKSLRFPNHRILFEKWW